MKGVRTKQETIDEYGLNTLQRAAIKCYTKALETKRKDIDPKTGLDGVQRSTAKGLRTKAETIIDGLNGFERAMINGGRVKMKKYKNTSIYFQGKWEEYFLQHIENSYGLKWLIKNVKRGESINYVWEDKHSWYLPDFIIKNVIFEIISSWTWNNNGTNKKLELRNKKKLKAAKKQGYKIRLVMEYNFKRFKKIVDKIIF